MNEAKQRRRCVRATFFTIEHTERQLYKGRNKYTSHNTKQLTVSISVSIFFFLRRVFLACILFRSLRMVSNCCVVHCVLSRNWKSEPISSSSSSLSVAETCWRMRSIA
jgi:hypothetical protein